MSIGPAMLVIAAGFAAHDPGWTRLILVLVLIRQQRANHAQRHGAADDRCGGRVLVFLRAIAAAAPRMELEITPAALVHPDTASVVTPGLTITAGIFA